MAVQVAGAALQFLEKKYGGRLRPVTGTVNVSLTPVELSDDDPETVLLVLINLGANAIWISPESSVTPSRGIQLQPSGQGMAFDVEVDGTLPTNKWWGVALVGPNTVYRLAVRRDIETIKGGA